MAGSDTQKQLLSLIRNFASEKSQGERRLVGLKKQIEELKCELDSAYADLEGAKLSKELVEQEVKGYEVQFAMNEASIQALEARISLIQSDISSVSSEVDAMKSEEESIRDEFISQMYDLNMKIRKFQEEKVQTILPVDCVTPKADEDRSEVQIIVGKEDAKGSLSDLPKKLENMISQANKEEERCQEELSIQKKLQQEMMEREKRLPLIVMIMEETKALQELTRQTSQLEATYNTLCQQLQKLCICPSCQSDNIEALDGGTFDSIQD